jgi:Protein of unknown function (DUF4019)
VTIPARLAQSEVAVKQLLGIILAGFMLVAVSAAADDTEQVAGAEAAALSWLSLTDRGEYVQSWDQAAGIFQSAISRENWINAIVNARRPFGKVIWRKTNSALYTRSLPGAPDGEYVVIQYDTQFEQKSAASEFVTPFRDKDGSWKVSGYYVK